MANVKKTTDAESVKDNETKETTVETSEAETVKEESVKSDTSSTLDTVNKTIDDVSGASSSNQTSRRREIDVNKEICVRSVTFGGLTWISQKTNAHYRWNEIGAEEYIPVSDLIAMNNSDQAFLTEPLVVLQDEDVVEYFRLAPVYKKIAVVNSLEDLIKEGDLAKIEKALRDIRNTSMRNVAISKIKELREKRVLNNIDVIRLVERILCFDME